MEAEYVTWPSRRSITVDIRNADDMVALIESLRDSYDDDVLPSIAIGENEIYLNVSPVGDARVCLGYGSATADWPSLSLFDPSNSDGDDITYWFTYGGDASELPSRYAIPQPLAMVVVQEFIANPHSIPQLDGFVWEPDWIVPSE